IYIIPLIGGVIVTIIILLTLKESSVYLTMKAEKRSNPEQLETQKKEGLGKALKKVRQLPNFDTLILITFIGMLAVMGGLADSNMEIYLAGLFTTDEVNIIYYLRYSISIVWGFIIGKIRDKYGRKPGLLITIIIQMICVILMIYFFRQGWLLIGGLTYGIYIYSVWMNPVTSGLIVNESIPTELRGSYTVFSSILSLLFFMIVGIIISILVLWFSYEQLFLMTCIPGSLIAIPIILKKVPETMGTDLTEV
ncbi:MAG: MFS transporter, partial [archaeon]|nr:MFS transporter [archaeon]